MLSMMSSFTKELDDFKSRCREQFGNADARLWRMGERLACLEETACDFDDRLDYLEAYSRRNCLLVYGLKEHPGEDLEAVVEDFLHDQIQESIDVALHVDWCHRVGSVHPSRSRPMVIKFTTYKIRAAVWKAKSRLKGTPMVVSELLTPRRWALYHRARKEFGVRQCWTSDGKVFVKLPDGRKHCISSEQQLWGAVLKRQAARARGNRNNQ